MDIIQTLDSLLTIIAFIGITLLAVAGVVNAVTEIQIYREFERIKKSERDSHVSLEMAE